VTLSQQDLRFRRAVRGFYVWIGAFLVAALVPFLAQSLSAAQSPVTRALAVALGIGAWVPIVLVVLWIVRSGDEYQRRLHITAGAVAFVLALLVILSWSWLVEARFVEAPPLQVVWISVGMCWAVSVFGVKRHFERRS
jgi:hypothetical protein